MRQKTSKDNLQAKEAILCARAIFLDCDGVLIDSLRLHDEAKRQTLKQFKVAIGEDEWSKIHHESISQIYDRVKSRLEDGSSKGQFCDYKRRYFSENMNNVELIPGSIVFLEAMKQKGKKVALVTAGQALTTDGFVKKFGLQKYFDAIVTGDDVNNLKPDPECYLIASQRLAVSPGEAIVIEDTRIGIESAKNAGCMIFAISGNEDEGGLRSAGAEVVFQAFGELI